MHYEHVPIIDLPAYQMDREGINTLSHIFTHGKAFARFVDLYTWFMVGLPEPDKVTEFWDEIEELGY